MTSLCCPGSGAVLDGMVSIPDVCVLSYFTKVFFLCFFFRIFGGWGGAGLSTKHVVITPVSLLQGGS